MSRPRTAAAVTRRGPAPRHPRRVSGPTRPRAVPGRPRPATPVASPTFADHLRALPDARLLDRLLRSRAWIWLLGIALGGIVAMQVSLLGMNAGISKAVGTSTDLQRSNALLKTEIARLQSGDRVAAAAVARGLATPDAGEVGVVKVRRRADPGRATITPPSDTARANLAAGGATAAPVDTTTTDPAAATTTDPTATTTDPATATTDPATATTDPATATTTDPATAVADPAATATDPATTADPAATVAPAVTAAPDAYAAGTP